jgi:beta-glucosidase
MNFPTASESAAAAGTASGIHKGSPGESVPELGEYAALAGVSPASARRIAQLPADFRWGAATSAYQIEGAVAEDGRTPSVWDTFCRVPGAIDNGDFGDLACDHYHRVAEDVALIKELDLDVYRFSIAWPRVQPHGRGPANPAGLDFYERLVDQLLEVGVDPWPTLFHWDTPQELEDAGGWANRDTAYRFADYAELVYNRLGDRVRTWTTLNEPSVVTTHGYLGGVHAPGRKSLADAAAAAHHQLLGHALAGRRMRELAASAGNDFSLAIVLNLGPATPESDTHEDREAVRRADAMNNRMYLDPLWHKRYPEDLVADLAAENVEIPVQDGDLELIGQPIDALGVNFYFGQQLSGRTEDGATEDEQGRPVSRHVLQGLPQTYMGWEIMPHDFTSLLVRVSREYPGVPVYITENGAAFGDKPDETGYVHDTDRVGYIADHLAAVADAREQGADIKGYYVWSLLDNFEWAFGFDKRFGIVRVDFDTFKRTPKLSARWFTETIRQVRGGTGA